MSESPFNAKQLAGFRSRKRGRQGERKALEVFEEFGWDAQKIGEDDGEDLLVEVIDTFTSSGLQFQVQLKTPLRLERKGEYAHYKLEPRQLLGWQDRNLPVFVMFWDVECNCGFWKLSDDIIKDLDSKSSRWRGQASVRTRVPVGNSTDPSGLKQMRLRAAQRVLPMIANGKTWEFNVTFEFPDTDAGQRERMLLEQYVETGEPVVISSQHVVQLRHSEWVEKLFGEEAAALRRDLNFQFGPREGVGQMGLTLHLAPSFGPKITHFFPMRAVQVGEKQLKLSNRALSPIIYTDVILRAGRSSLTFSPVEFSSSAAEASAVLRIADALSAGGTLQFRVLTDLNHEFATLKKDFEPLEGMSPASSYRQMVTDLNEVEQTTGVQFRIPSHGTTQGEASAASKALQIVRSGRWVIPFSHYLLPIQRSNSGVQGDPVWWQAPANKTTNSADFEGAVEWIIQKHEQGLDQEFFKEYRSNIVCLGKSIPLGICRKRISGRLSDDCYRELGESGQAGADFASVIFKIEAGSIEETYPEWLPKGKESATEMA